jgi:hypothetical protein
MRDRPSWTPRWASLTPVPRDIAMELTLDIQRGPLDLVVAAANDAYDRIKTHRKLFRRDWLPFQAGVYYLSIQAWEATGRRTRLDRKPDWTYDLLQVTFRALIRPLPWADYIEGRRDLLCVLRHIGDERERFMGWYDHPDREEMRERVGHPVTLWKKFASEVLKPAEHNNNDEPAQHHDDERAEHNNDEYDHNNDGDEEVEARTDADRMADLVAANETCRDFCLKLRASVNDGRSTLEAGLREELDRLLEAEDVA